VLRKQLDDAFDDLETRLEDFETRASVAEARASVAEARASVAETRTAEAERRANEALQRVDDLIAVLAGNEVPDRGDRPATKPPAGDLDDDANADVTPQVGTSATELREALERLRGRLEAS
jgi:phage shock protein A